MKIKKVTEDFENELNSVFYFLNYSKYSKDPVKFLKSLNLTSEQYTKLSQIMEDYGQEKFSEGFQNGIDQNQD